MTVVVTESSDLPRPELQSLATEIGEAWAMEIIRTLRSDDREIAGAWPGTLREARMRIRSAMRSRLELEVIDALAKVAYVAARRGWHELSVPDPES